MTEKEIREIKLKHLKNNLQIYKDHVDLVVLYETYIRRIVELLDFVGMKNNDLFHTVVFDILTDIGFFSYNNTLDSKVDEFKELTIKPGINVVTGEAVCRNVACFYKDVFRHFYDYPLTLCCYDKTVTSDKDTAIYGNHMINLTMYHDALYGFDVLNHGLFKPIDRTNLTGVGFDYKLAYKQYGDLLVHLTTQLSLEDSFVLESSLKRVLMKVSSKKETIPIEDYEKIIDDANEFIIGNKKIFKSFHEDNIGIQNEIKQKMLLLK